MMNHESQYDRFIPNRSAMDLDYAMFELTETLRMKRQGTKARSSVSSSRKAYNKQLAEVLGLNRTRILSFKNKRPPSSSSPRMFRPVKQAPTRHIPQIAERKLDATGLVVDDLYLNLLDWGSSDVLAIAFSNSVYLLDAWDCTDYYELFEDDDQGQGLVTSLNWPPDGRKLAVGFNNSQVQIWDSYVRRCLRTLEAYHDSGVGSLAWRNNDVLTSGDMDGLIVNNDVRVRSHAVSTSSTSRLGHRQEVCGLKWSQSGNQLASAGCDSVVRIWDSSSSEQSLHTFREHTSAVKALAWCPFQTNLLATGGHDGMIKFWSTSTGACLDSVDTGSQVSSLLWSNKERELLSSHGNQLTLFKYPSMLKMAQLTGHNSSVLFMTQSPNDCTAGADEYLRFWNVFGDPDSVKAPAASRPFPLSPFTFIR